MTLSSLNNTIAITIFFIIVCGVFATLSKYIYGQCSSSSKMIDEWLIYCDLIVSFNFDKVICMFCSELRYKPRNIFQLTKNDNRQNFRSQLAG